MPNQQNPYTAGIDSVMSDNGYTNRETFVVGGGGQSVFDTQKKINAGVSVFEDGVLTSKAVNITGNKEVTTDLIPEGTVVDIIY